MSPAAGTEIEIAGRQLRVTNLDKVLYPDDGFTKAEVIDYYVRVADTMLRHIAGRPMTLKRYPDGVDSEPFYEKNCPKHRPPWMPTHQVYAGSAKRHIQFCLIEEPAALAWTANLAALELHVSLTRVKEDLPGAVVFDLDPGAPATIVECCRVGLLVRDLLAAQGLETYAKTSGSKGLQLYAPINGSGQDYDVTKTFARAVAQFLESQSPDLVVSRMAKVEREGKVFVDWSQNDPAKTTVAVYSLRARERPWVSTPVTWDEVEACLAAGDPELLRFTSTDVLGRIDELGDLFAPVDEQQQAVPQT